MRTRRARQLSLATGGPEKRQPAVDELAEADDYDGVGGSSLSGAFRSIPVRLSSYCDVLEGG